MPGQSSGSTIAIDEVGAIEAVSDWYVRIGRLIRRERLARGWSQGELARRTGTDQRMVSRIETGISPHPEPRALLSMSVVLTVSRAELAEVLEIGDYMSLDHHLPDLDEPRIKQLYRRLVKLSAADQWLAIGIFEQLVNRFRAGEGPRRVVHLVAGLVATRVLLDMVSDGKMNGVIKFAAELCARGRGVL